MTKDEYVRIVRSSLDSLPPQHRDVVVKAAMDRYTELVASGQAPRWELSEADFR